jgi:hypothetical protein
MKLLDLINNLMISKSVQNTRTIEQKLKDDFCSFILPHNCSSYDFINWAVNHKNYKLKLTETSLNQNYNCNEQENSLLFTINGIKVKIMSHNHFEILKSKVEREILNNKKNEDLDDNEEMEEDYILFVLNNNNQTDKENGVEKKEEEDDDDEDSGGHLLINRYQIDKVIKKETRLQNESNKVRQLNNSGTALRQENEEYHKNYKTEQDEKLRKYQERYINDNKNFIGSQFLLQNQLTINKTTTKTSNKLKSSPISTISSTETSSLTTSSASSPSPLTISQSPRTLNKISNFVQIEPNDVNEPLFNWLLSNFCCKLTDDFISCYSKSTKTTGFIRKRFNDKSFSFCNISNGPSGGLEVNKMTISLSIQLSDWPESYLNRFFTLPTKATKSKQQIFWRPSNDLLDKLRYKCCSIRINHNHEWTVDTELAETTLFNSLSRRQKFVYFFIFTIIEQLELDTTTTTTTTTGDDGTKNILKIGNFLTKRMYLHHYLWFIETNQIDLVDPTKMSKRNPLAIHQLGDILIKFSAHLRLNVLSKYKTFNRPNYFNAKKRINSNSNHIEVDLHLNSVISRLVNFEAKVNPAAIRSSSGSKLISYIAYFDNYLSLLDYSRLSTRSRLVDSVEKNLNLKIKVHIYKYIYAYLTELCQMFCIKQDHFQLSEKKLFELHNMFKYKDDVDGDSDEIDEALRSFRDAFNQAIQQRDTHLLTVLFEDYASYVHNYLQSIRQQNKYLLFHNIWTMQMQYLTPFFNYVCDFDNLLLNVE